MHASTGIWTFLFLQSGNTLTLHFHFRFVNFLEGGIRNREFSEMSLAKWLSVSKLTEDNCDFISLQSRLMEYLSGLVSSYGLCVLNDFSFGDDPLP